MCFFTVMYASRSFSDRKVSVKKTSNFLKLLQILVSSGSGQGSNGFKVKAKLYSWLFFSFMLSYDILYISFWKQRNYFLVNLFWLLCSKKNTVRYLSGYSGENPAPSGSHISATFLVYFRHIYTATTQHSPNIYTPHVQHISSAHLQHIYTTITQHLHSIHTINTAHLHNISTAHLPSIYSCTHLPSIYTTNPPHFWYICPAFPNPLPTFTQHLHSIHIAFP
jgi:hypothetical protein